MRKRGITKEQSRWYLLSSLIIFFAVEIVAEITQLWLVGKPSLSNLNTYNRSLSVIPEAMSTGASVFLAFGLSYQPRGRVYAIVALGIVISALSFTLVNINFLSSTFEYASGLTWTIPSGILSGLFFIGTATFVAGIMSIVLRDSIIRKTGIEA